MTRALIEDLQDTAVHQRRRRSKEDTEMDITPMIDVTFLLLIFFIVASKLDPQKVVDTPLAKHGDAVAEKYSVTIIVTNSGGETPNVFLGDSKDEAAKAKGSLEDMEDAIADYVRQELDANPQLRQVLIKAERDVKYRHIHFIKRSISRSLDEQSLHIAVKEKK